MRNGLGQSIASRKLSGQILNEFLPISNLYVDKLMLNEWHIYGSSRLGIYKAEVLVASKTLTQSNGQSANTNTQGSNTNGQANNTTNPPIYSLVEQNPPIPDYTSYSQIRGAKNYELSNHLGNVLVVVTDKKTYNCGNTELINANFDNGSYNNIFPITSNTSMSLSGNKLNVSGTNTQVGTLFNTEGEAGRIFKVDFDLTIGGGISQVWFETNASYNSTGGGLRQNITNSSSSGHVSFTFTAPQGAYRFKLGGIGTGTYSIDNLIVKEVGPGRYQAEIVTANDYSPFGAPMPGRSFKADNVLVKTTLSNSNFTTGTDGWVATTNATLSNVFGNIRATVTAVNAGMKKTFSTEPGKTYRVMFKINLRGWPYMYIKDKYTNTNLLSITNYIEPGDASYTFTATGFETDVIFNEASNPAGSIQLANFTLEEVEANSGYRFSFNGKEGDNETQTQDYGFRIYNGRLGRFLSVDPLTAKFPDLSSYQYASNTPIWAIDFDGLEAFFIHGTASGPNRWNKQDEAIGVAMSLTNNKEKDFGFEWKNDGFFNTESDRTLAAKQLATYIIAHRVPGEEITLIGHSHGGNVAIQAAEMVSEALGEKVNIITFGTPAYNAIENNKENPANYGNYINDMIHIYSEFDRVQVNLANAVGAKDAIRTFNAPFVRNYQIEDKLFKKLNKDAHFFDLNQPKQIEKLSIPKLKSVNSKSSAASNNNSYTPAPALDSSLEGYSNEN